MDKRNLRIVFMGTPEFAVESLRTLVEGGYNVVAVVTQPDRPVGRHGSVLRAPEVKLYAQSVGLPVLQPEKMKDPVFVEALRSYNADLQVVVAFRMLPEIVWAMPRFGTFNVHAALLPQYRGAAPINWAVINGETQTGVTTFFLDHDIDTGRVILQRPFDIPETEDAGYVHDGLMHLGAQAAKDTIDLLLANDGNIDTIAQDTLVEDGVSLRHAPKIFRDTCRINWQQPAKKVYDFIRGLSPYPGAWTMVGAEHAKQMKIFNAHITSEPSKGWLTDNPDVERHSQVVDGGASRMIIHQKGVYFAASDYLLEVFTLQPEGRKRMSSTDYINGIQF